METELHGLVLLSVEALFHDLRPDAAGCAELRNLFEDIVVSVPEERETASEIIDMQASLDGCLAVCDAVRDRECDFLCCRGTSLADMVAGDGDRVPLRDVLRAILEDVRDEAHGRTRREDVRAACCILLEDIVLDRAAELVCRDALLLCHCDVHREQDGSRGIDRHGRGDLAEVDLVKEDFHVSERVDRDADLADFAFGNRIIGIITDLRRQIECTRKARRTVFNQHAIALVRLLCRGEACVHAHRPEAAAIHRRLNAARVRVDAREADLVCVIRILDVERRVEALLRQVVTLRETCDGFFYARLIFCELCLDFLVFRAHIEFSSWFSSVLVLYLFQGKNPCTWLISASCQS